MIEQFNVISLKNKDILSTVSWCSCYFCLKYSLTENLTTWTDNGYTALCPNCDVDALIPDLVEVDILKEAHARWFGENYVVNLYK